MNNNFFQKEKEWLLQEKYKNQENENFFKDLEKLKKGYPLAFLIGNIDFINTKIDLEFKPLIPRPETEFWIYEYIFPKIKWNFAEKNSTLKILDIFSGSGCIGLSILNNFQNQNLEVDFGEIKNENILQIKKNIKFNKLNKKNNFQIFKSDVFKKIPEKKYDFILANPPYISENKKNTVQNSVLNFEDKKALFAPNDGLYFIKKTISEGLKYLNRNGEIWIEFDPWQKELIINFLKNKKNIKYNFYQDQYKKYRFLQISFSK